MLNCIFIIVERLPPDTVSSTPENAKKIKPTLRLVNRSSVKKVAIIDEVRGFNAFIVDALAAEVYRRAVNWNAK